MFQSWEMMNTAVLTGRQVSQSMKVFMVSEAGSVADVTLHTSCTTADHSALKVGDSGSNFGVHIETDATRSVICVCLILHCLCYFKCNIEQKCKNISFTFLEALFTTTSKICEMVHNKLHVTAVQLSSWCTFFIKYFCILKLLLLFLHKYSSRRCKVKLIQLK